MNAAFRLIDTVFCRIDTVLYRMDTANGRKDAASRIIDNPQQRRDKPLRATVSDTLGCPAFAASRKLTRDFIISARPCYTRKPRARADYQRPGDIKKIILTRFLAPFSGPISYKPSDFHHLSDRNSSGNTSSGSLPSFSKRSNHSWRRAIGN